MINYNLQRKILFNDVIDLLLSVRWTQKITAKNYDRLAKYSMFIKWFKAISAVLTSGTVATLFDSNSSQAKYIAIIGALIFTALEVISNQFNIVKDQVNLFEAKEDFWEKSILLTNLAREIKFSENASESDLKGWQVQYKSILNRIKEVQSGLPSVPLRVVHKAEKEIKDAHASNNWENKNQLLPPDIRQFSKEN
ncbi:hypothetical protein [Lactobacillus panisapium]|uniref:SMODS and SLOG-associating 2TM effector domain-containing protein n=1 Tax=Lactobacillus panisapium TaxID=2012495 RepID=A0ABX8W6K7_9LACO|nr:hypothetical protein [Lactobacillus panisapium]QYN53406.1 hypothetical protein GYM71_08235 [Lactobacillus panisapium]